MLTEQQKIRIMEQVCDLCHWPFVYIAPFYEQEDLENEKCNYCPIEQIFKEIENGEI